MRLVSCKCPSCSGELDNLEFGTTVCCQYCGSKFFVDDGVVHVEHRISLEEAIQAGYNFEQGRIQAVRDEESRKLEEQRKELEIQKAERRDKLIKTVLLWVLFFPVMASVKVWRSKRFDRDTKVVLIALIWIGVFSLYRSIF